MLYLLWDASGLAKRYIPEAGTATVLALWQSILPRRMATTFIGYTETYSILLRKHRRHEISASALANGKALLQRETVHSLDLTMIAVNTLDILTGLPFMEKYSPNSSDAAILAAFLRYAPTTSDTCVVVASDARLIRAALAEGLKTLNPELLSAADVPAFLASL